MHACGQSRHTCLQLFMCSQYAHSVQHSRRGYGRLRSKYDM